MSPVKQKTFKLLQWLVPAFLGVATLIVGGVAVYFSLQRIPTAAEVLPAEATIAYWHLTDDGAALPGLPAGLPAMKWPADIAMLQSPSGIQWVAFPGAPNDPLLKQAKAIDGKAYVASSPDVDALLASPDPKLWTDSTLRALRSGVDSRTSFRFSRLGPQTRPSATPLQRLIGSHAPTAMLQFADGTKTILRFYGKTGTGAWALPLPLPSFSPAAVRILVLSAPADAWQRYLGGLPPRERTLQQAMLKTTVRDWFGEDVSLEFDVLPLLQTQAVIVMGNKTGDGRTPFLLEGRARGAGVAERLNRIRRSAQGSMGGGTVTEREFEDGVTVRQVRAGDETANEVQSERGGWTVSVSGTASDSIITAVRGDTFLISNAPAWVNQRIDGSVEIPGLPLGRGEFVAGGVASGTDSSLLSPADPMIRELAGGSLPERFAWAMERWGRVLQVSWQTL